MQARMLYVVGNGFDLWHGIPSAYWQFKEFIEKHDSSLLEAVESYLPVRESWSDLESALADLGPDHIVDCLGYWMVPYGAEGFSESAHYDFQREVAHVANLLSERLRCQFGRWIRQLRMPTPGTESKKLRHIDRAAAFLTFNYTLTLQELYGVPHAHILHIHGRADLQDEELVLGHAWDPRDRPPLSERLDIDRIDTRLMEAYAILDEFFSKTFKPSAHLIQKHHSFFEGLTNVEMVNLMGHSLDEVDDLYFHRLLAIPAIAAARWHVACLPGCDPQERCARLERIGVPASNVVICYWSDL